MLRTSIIRTARSAVRPSSTTLSKAIAARFESSYSKPKKPVPPPSGVPKTPEQLLRKAALRQQDELQRDWDAKLIFYEEFVKKTESPTPGKYIIDVREPDEVIQGMIPSAVNVPLSVLAGALNVPPEEFKTTYGFEKPKQDQEIVFYCRSGKRSSTACDVAKRNGYTNLLNYKGSWLDWTEQQNKKA